MKPTTLIASITLLSGCAMSPADLRTQGAAYEYTLSSTPPTATRCIIRNAEERSASTIAKESPATPDGAIEIIVRQTSEVSESLAIALVRPANTGSTVSMRVNPGLISPSTEQYGKALIAGC